MNERDLLGRAPQRDWPAFDILFRQTVHPVHRFLLGLCGDRLQAEALAVRTFEAAWQHGVPDHTRMPFVAWVLRLALQLTRREGVGGPALVGEAPDGVETGVWWAFQGLDREAKAALLLRVGEGLPTGVVAQVTGADVAAVRAAVYRGAVISSGAAPNGLPVRQWDAFERLLDAARADGGEDASGDPLVRGARSVARMYQRLRAAPAFVLRTKVKLATAAKAEAHDKKGNGRMNRRRNNGRGPAFVEVQNPERAASGHRLTGGLPPQRQRAAGRQHPAGDAGCP